jgi:enamine deaminase RidA (YjgF/YER057c/UK114 family)
VPRAPSPSPSLILSSHPLILSLSKDERMHPPLRQHAKDPDMNQPTVAQRLAELGIHLPEPSIAGIYRPAVRTRDQVYVSGQIALRDGAIVHPGRLGAEVGLEQGQEAARICAINGLGAAHALLGSLEGLRVIRLAVYVASTAEFTQQPQVANGASELLRDLFGEEHGIGARVALGVASLPANTPVELELLLELD